MSGFQTAVLVDGTNLNYQLHIVQILLGVLRKNKKGIIAENILEVLTGYNN